MVRKMRHARAAAKMPLDARRFGVAFIAALAVVSGATATVASRTDAQSSVRSGPVTVIGTAHIRQTFVGRTTTGPIKGRVLADSSGFPLYTEYPTHAPRTCNARCQATHKPLVVRGVLKAASGSGVKQRLLSAVRLADGSLQAAYAGWPLYTYTGDKRPYTSSGDDQQYFRYVFVLLDVAGRYVLPPRSCPQPGPCLS
jgi:predicted lipoprotein with Yx(FWY)xxD motif